MKQFVILSAATLLTVGCQSELSNPNLQAAKVRSQAKQSGANQTAVRNREYWSKFSQAEKLASDPQTHAEAETQLLALLTERPQTGSPYLVLAHMYQAQGEERKAAVAFDDFLASQTEKASQSVSRYDWYSMYLAFKVVGKETESREALRNVLASKGPYSEATYADTRTAPSLTVIRMAEIEAAQSVRSGPHYEKGIEMFEALSKKDGLTPKMMMELSNVLLVAGKRESGTELLWKLYRLDSPYKDKAKSDLIQLGEIKSENGPGQRYRVPRLNGGVSSNPGSTQG